MLFTSFLCLECTRIVVDLICEILLCEKLVCEILLCENLLARICFREIACEIFIANPFISSEAKDAHV